MNDYSREKLDVAMGDCDNALAAINEVLKGE